MKIRLSLLLVPFVLVTLPLHGQSFEGEYLHIDYLVVQPEAENEFLDHIQANWADQQSERLENEEISGWQLYKVRYPGNPDNRYNYVSVTSANSMTAFESLQTPVDMDSQSDHRQQALKSQISVAHSELWRVRNSVTKEDDFQPSRFMMMDYMNVALGREYEYQMFEDEIARPLHEDRMELDRMNAWELYQLITPGGMNYGYNFSTGNFFNNLEHIEFGFTDELIRANHPEVNMMDFFQTIFSTRDLVQSSLWELIEYVR